MEELMNLVGILCQVFQEYIKILLFLFGILIQIQYAIWNATVLGNQNVSLEEII